MKQYWQRRNHDLENERDIKTPKALLLDRGAEVTELGEMWRRSPYSVDYRGYGEGRELLYKGPGQSPGNKRNLRRYKSESDFTCIR